MTIKNVRADHFSIPLPVVLSDSTHGDIPSFELITARVDKMSKKVSLLGLGK